MAFDGICIAALAKELSDKLIGGRLYKIAQPEEDELFITVKNNKDQYRLLMSANASLPLVYITEENRQSPLTAPNFCMLLRKHINNGRIVNIYQPDLERIINFEIEHLDEMGDLKKKTLIIELMGKHSNIIFCDENNIIIDSIKHIPAHISSVREVLPGRDYFIPNTTEKSDPTDISKDAFFSSVFSKPTLLSKAIYTSLTGISPVIAEEICHIAGMDSCLSAANLNDNEKIHLYNIFNNYMEKVKNKEFAPCMIKKNNEPVEFCVTSLSIYDSADYIKIYSDSINEILMQFYEAKNSYTRIRKHSAELRQIVSTALERNYKKYDLQQKQLIDTEKRDKYRIYGELLNTYGYNVAEGEKTLNCLNYYTNEDITIPLDPDLSARENSIKYFDKYNKLKRTYEALSKLIVETQEEIYHLESINNSLDIAVSYDDLVQIKEEMIEYGYIHKKRSNSSKKEKCKSQPFHYISSDGFHMYVGKNNFQNEDLTFKLATGNDWWFHAKSIPGSHVIVKAENQELPDNTFEEAARLAAYYSKAKDQEKVEIDYIQKKHIKKPNTNKPGLVIYHTNYSMNIDNNPNKMGKLQE